MTRSPGDQYQKMMAWKVVPADWPVFLKTVRPGAGGVWNIGRKWPVHSVAPWNRLLVVSILWVLQSNPDMSPAKVAATLIPSWPIMLHGQQPSWDWMPTSSIDLISGQDVRLRISPESGKRSASLFRPAYEKPILDAGIYNLAGMEIHRKSGLNTNDLEFDRGNLPGTATPISPVPGRGGNTKDRLCRLILVRRINRFISGFPNFGKPASLNKPLDNG